MRYELECSCGVGASGTWDGLESLFMDHWGTPRHNVRRSLVSGSQWFKDIA